MSPTGPGGPAYRVPLPSRATPEAAVAGLALADGPAVLWGRWFGGGVLLFRQPSRRLRTPTAEEAFATLREVHLGGAADGTPDGVVGGGWVAALGYSPGSTVLSWYDCLARWRPGSGWCFESLGRRAPEAEAEALAGWTAFLDAAADRGSTPPNTARAGPASPAPFRPRGPVSEVREGYLAAVEDAVGRIRRGEVYQLNLCLRLSAPWPNADPIACFATTAGRLDPAYGSLVTGPDGPYGRHVTLSFSPELFLAVSGDTVRTSPIKGTAPRRTGDLDSPALRASAKDAAENVMIVDLMRNDLARVCRPGTVRVAELLDLQAHPGVWHLVSTVEGRLSPGVGPGELLQATFPPGSVTGAPKLAACQAIEELEPEPRHGHTGALGLLSPVSGLELSVTIRTLELRGDRAELGVGGGITADSVPTREWHECLHKAAPIVTAAGGRLDAALRAEPPAPPAELIAGGVFESVLARRGVAMRLAAHLARLDASCRELYGVGLPDDLAGRVRRLSARHPEVDRLAVRVLARPDRGARLRLTLHTRPLGAPPPAAALRLGRRPERSWRHKWAERHGLEAAERRVAPDLPWFTTADGAVAETSRGNLFLADGAGWHTPVLDEDLLPGVTRRAVVDLLADLGEPVRLRRCDPDELRTARAAFWTSSLSGVVAVTAVDGRPVGTEQRLLGELNRRLGLP